VLYEARPAAGLSPATVRALAGGLIDFALFFSPRTATIFARLAARAGIAAALRNVTAVSISAAADGALADVEFQARHIAATADQRGLLAALDAIVAKRRGT